MKHLAAVVILCHCILRGFAQELVEATTLPILSTTICDTCSCEGDSVDCHDRNIRTPFSIEEWGGLSPLSPKIVDLSSNPLITFTSTASLPIQSLNLSNCELESLGDFCFTNLLDLVSLDLGRNKIATSAISRKVFLPQMFPDSPPKPFQNLRKLYLSYNDIHSLPQDLFIGMPDITELDFSGNPLAFIDQVTMAALSELTKLQVLKLSSCELETLPEGLLRRQRYLRNLDLSDNRFTTIPAILSEASNLISLNLDKNPFTALEEGTSLSKLPKLQELHLCRLSKLQSISSRALGNLPSLVTLNICYNPRLTTLDPGFLTWLDEDEVERYPKVTKLNLNHNNLTVINSHFLERWDILTEVDFTDNPYVCDCNGQWMIDVLVPMIRNTMANESVNNMICSKPAELRGLSFANLREEARTLVCSEPEKLIKETSEIAVVLGIMIGIFVTFPLVLVLVLAWRRGWLARCGGRRKPPPYYDYETDDL